MEKVLQYILENGIINIDDVQEKMKEEERQRILKQHSYKIFQANDGRWKTTVPDESKSSGRRLIAKSNLKKLEDAIIECYTLKEDKQISEDLKTLRDIYSEWQEYKMIHTTADSYIKRIDNDWKRFYLNSNIIDLPLYQLDFITLDTWANKLIKDNNLTKKQYYNATIIIRQCLDYCCNKKIIEFNNFSKVKIDKKMFYKKPKPKSNTQVFMTNEEDIIKQYAMQKFQDKPKFTTPLAVLFNFQLGLRVGELLALKWSDIDGNYITIQREEVSLYDIVNKKVVYCGKGVAEHTKTSSEASFRTLYLTTEARKILNLIKETNDEYGYYDNGYIFVSCNNNRLTTNVFNDYLYGLCDNINISRKSSHKIRKTFISSLFDAGININTIREIAGHEDEKTSLNNYCFDRTEKKDLEKDLENISNTIRNNEKKLA